MIVALGSMFRNSTGYLDRYVDQVFALDNALAANGDRLRLILAEGDSLDRTWEQLHERAAVTGIECVILKREHGGPQFGSVNVEQRWRQISFVMDGVLEQIRRSDDAFIWVESDLIWQPATMLRLLDDLRSVPCATCFSFGEGTRRHYDTWGHRGLDGVGFTQFEPYHADLKPRGLTEILSAGSVIVCRGDAAYDSHCDPGTEGPVDWCREMRGRGFGLWFDPTVAVEHP